MPKKKAKRSERKLASLKPREASRGTGRLAAETIRGGAAPKRSDFVIKG